MKKTVIFRKIAAALLAAFTLFSAFSLTASADNENYGEDAYTYLRIINDSFAYRINNNEITSDKSQLQGMRSFIEGKMGEFGYAPNYWQGEISGHTFTSMTYKKAGNSEKRIVIGAHYDSAETKGCEDNGTGLSVLLELAKRFQNTDTALTLEFCFWDGEEFRGMAGSYLYLEQVPDPENILLYINLDCLGAGDNMYVYGGDYDDAGVLQRSWGYNMAMTLSQELGVDLHDMPAGVSLYTPPTRTTASDQFYFNERGIPYVYFEANAWLTAEGVEGNPEKPYNYNSTLSCFADTNGRIIHTKYDDMDVLETLVPGRLRDHMTQFSKVISEMIRRMDTESPAAYATYVRYSAPVITEPESSETETASEEADTSETTAETSEDPENTPVSVTSEAETEEKKEEAPENDTRKETFENADSGDKTDVKQELTKRERFFSGMAWTIIVLMGLVFLFSVCKIVIWVKKK